MPSEISDEEIDKKRTSVEKLSEKVEQAKRELAISEMGRHNTVAMASLTAEEDRLQAELDQLRENLKVSKSDPSKDSVVQQIQGNVPDQLTDQEEAADGIKGTK